MAAERRSPLAMVVLALLAEEPMHAYRIQSKIRSRRQDEIVNVAQRNSVYQAIERLVRDGYAAVRHTDREGGRPERTVYEITPAGRAMLIDRLRAMLSTPAREFPEFPAALAFVMLLDAQDARVQLEKRASALAARLATLAGDIETSDRMGLPRLFVLETEYALAATRTELDFVRGVAGDLAAGRLTWSPEWLADMAAHFEP
ncbi:PadR family transcriptional regulator [Hamadaea tsunoensis]|uniref:PadR family transcriptional regulator n=1 Tax=Hamadaea tsunoensis TaxID=53368 RepID=UPI0003F95AAD|nr:PadR family transcriptional regulator [Hamadaea tsunoensis]